MTDDKDTWAKEVYEEMRDLVKIYQVKRSFPPYCLKCEDYIKGSVNNHILYHMTTRTPPPEFS